MNGVTLEIDNGEKQLCIFKKCERPLDLHFTNLTYKSPGKCETEKPEKYILKSLNGRCEPGKLTVILGPSGAGKSSLLNVLSGLRTTGVSGNIMVNGKPRSLHEFKKLSCYIPQDFALMLLLTVEETLFIAADLKFGRNFETAKKSTMVTEILRVLGLLESSNTLVKHLSGGEKKRLSIGLELLTNPPIMFLDEPTSGLDSTSALELMLHLKNLAQDNRAIVCVVHQPSSMMFNIFDNLYILNRGQFIYGGPACEMVSKFAAYGFVCPKYYNPADYVLDTIKRNEEFFKTAASTVSAGKPNVNGVVLKDNMTVLNNEDISFSKDDNDFHEETFMAHSNVRTIEQCIILLKRAMICSKRDMHMTYFKIATALFISLLVGALWYDAGNQAEKTISNVAAIFIVVAAAYACNCLLTVMSYPHEAAAVSREHRNNWYSTRAYFFSKLIAEFPLQFLCATLLILPLYFLTGQPVEKYRIFVCWGIVVLLVIMAQTHGMALGTLFPQNMSVNILIVYAIVCALLSGFPLQIDFIPIYARWFAKINCLKFGLEGLVGAIYGLNRDDLNCDQPYCYFKSPRKILEQVHMENYSIQWDMLGLCIWIFIYQALFYFALRWKHRISH